MAQVRSVHPSWIPKSHSRKHNFFGENFIRCAYFIKDKFYMMCPTIMFGLPRSC